MKRFLHFYLSMLILFIAAPIWSQWMPFFENEEVLFAIEGHYIGLKFDEVVNQLDRKILYPAKVDNCPDCKSHWVGKQIELFPNGDHIFYNENDEACLIRASAKLNEEWVVLSRATKRLIGKCVDVAYAEVLGVMDSVKTFHFYMVDTAGNAVYHMSEETQFQISKNHGYVLMNDFQQFPEGVNFMNTDYYLFISLAGLSKDNLGQQSLSWSEAIELEPGDEFHIIEANGTGDYYTGIFNDYNYYIKAHVLSKEYLSDSVVYTVDKKQFFRYYFINTLIDSALTSEIVKWKFPIENSNFDLFESISYMTNAKDGYNLGIPSSFGPAKLFHVTSYSPFYVDLDDSRRENKYIRGAAGPYFSRRSEYGESYNSRNLVYSNNRFGIIGAPLDSILFIDRAILIDTMMIDTMMVDTMIIDTMVIDTMVIDTMGTTDTMKIVDTLFYVEHIRIGPNPVDQQLIISSDSTTLLSHVTLFKLSGEIVWNLTSINTDKIEVALDLPSGVYICLVLTSNNKSVTKKLLKL